MTHVPDWFRSAVVYHVFVPSFQDGDGDGIGDLPGLATRLDDLATLGVDVLWLSPICDSPFRDAGYDVRDFCRVAPRYGTETDFRQLCAAAAARGMRVLLDFVPGHTSDEHPWFIESCRHACNPYSDRYLWTDSMWEVPRRADGRDFHHLSGVGEREGNVAVNFFSCQPKLNYGFTRPDPTRPEQFPVDHPAVRALVSEMKDVMRFWLDLGAAGFRIDSCGSLVQGPLDPGGRHVVREFRELVDAEYPDAVLVGEWAKSPAAAAVSGLHASFVLHNQPPFIDLYPLPGWENHAGTPFFDPEGRGDARPFLAHFQAEYDALPDPGFWCLFSGNHDYRRLASNRPPEHAAAINALVLTMPGTPFLYYGSEIGMVDLDGLPSKEGAYRRTGCRTPMQWDGGPNAGFSSADPARLYLPLHPEASRCNVAVQRGRPDSTWEQTRRLIALRRGLPQLRADAGFRPLPSAAPAVLAYLRGDPGQSPVLVAINPGPTPRTLRDVALAGGAELLAGEGAVAAGELCLPPRGYAILRCVPG